MFEDILKRIKPSKEEEKRVFEIINELIDRFERKGLNIFLGGSFAKNTWISNNYDVDLFVLFNKGEEMSKRIEDVLREEKLNFVRVKGSRDYFKVFHRGIEFELVPILKINRVEEAENVTDLSPFHVYYVRSKIKGREDEVRLLKVFMKSIGVYGAESYIRGFSGYAAELLIIYYNTFYNLILNSQNWKLKVFIDIEGIYKDLRDAVKIMGRDRTKSPIIIVDPVYPIRNASSSVSVQKFSEFILYSRFLLNDIKDGRDISKYFEIKKKVDVESYLRIAKRYGANLLYVEIEGKGESKDIKNSKALKFFKRILKEIESKGFPILRKTVIFDDKLIGIVYLYLDKSLSYIKKRGPLVWDKSNLDTFLEKHKDDEIFVEEDGRVYAIVNKRVKLEEVIEELHKRYGEIIDKFYYKIY